MSREERQAEKFDRMLMRLSDANMLPIERKLPNGETISIAKSDKPIVVPPAPKAFEPTEFDELSLWSLDVLGDTGARTTKYSVDLRAELRARGDKFGESMLLWLPEAVVCNFPQWMWEELTDAQYITACASEFQQHFNTIIRRYKDFYGLAEQIEKNGLISNFTGHTLGYATMYIPVKRAEGIRGAYHDFVTPNEQFNVAVYARALSGKTGENIPVVKELEFNGAGFKTDATAYNHFLKTNYDWCVENGGPPIHAEA